MAEDIDSVYKARFRELTEKLGRAPNMQDREYWELTEWLRRAYEERKVNPRAVVETPSSVARAREERVTAEGAPGGPTLTADGSPALSEPEASSVNSGAPEGPEASQADDPLAGLLIGARGPNGGMVARCDGCGRMWEREKRRGRPAVKCEECR